MTRRPVDTRTRGRTPRQKDARVESAATEERVTAQASAGQRTQSLACRGRKSALKVLTSRKEPLLPEPAWDRHPQVSMDVPRRSNRLPTLPPCLAWNCDRRASSATF